MAIRRGTSAPKAIYRGSTPVQKVYRGSTLVWSADPLTHWAKLESPNLSVNSGSAGGNFTLGAAIYTRTPGAWFPSGSYMHSPAGGWESGFTVAAWIKTTKAVNEAPIGISATGGGMYFMHNASGDGKIAALINIDGQFLTLTSSVSVTMSSWVHVALVVWPDGNTANLWHGQMFLDGSTAAYSTISGAGAPPSESTFVVGAAYEHSSGAQWEGDLDEARLYLTPLTGTQIAAIFDAETATYPLGGTYTGDQVTVGTSLTLAYTHTVQRAGQATLTGTGTWNTSTFTRQVQVRLNGTTVADASTTTNSVTPTATSTSRALAVGDTVQVWARHSSAYSNSRLFTPQLKFN